MVTLLPLPSWRRILVGKVLPLRFANPSLIYSCSFSFQHLALAQSGSPFNRDFRNAEPLLPGPSPRWPA